MNRYQEMTPQALACRADSFEDFDTVNAYLGGEDERQITAFFKHEECDLDGDTPDGFTVPGLCRELIGVTLDSDVLSADEASDMFGRKVIVAWEGYAWRAGE